MKVGDTVVVKDYSLIEKVKISRETKTLWIIKRVNFIGHPYEIKFNKSDLHEVGNSRTIREITPMDESYFNRRELLEKIAKINFQAIDTGILEKIVELIK